jgi:hypothetical protein
LDFVWRTSSGTECNCCGGGVASCSSSGSSILLVCDLRKTRRGASSRPLPKRLLPWVSSRRRGGGQSVAGLVAALLDPEILPRAADLG